MAQFEKVLRSNSEVIYNFYSFSKWLWHDDCVLCCTERDRFSNIFLLFIHELCKNMFVGCFSRILLAGVWRFLCVLILENYFSVPSVMSVRSSWCYYFCRFRFVHCSVVCLFSSFSSFPLFVSHVSCVLFIFCFSRVSSPLAGAVHWKAGMISTPTFSSESHQRSAMPNKYAEWKKNSARNEERERNLLFLFVFTVVMNRKVVMENATMMMMWCVARWTHKKLKK